MPGNGLEAQVLLGRPGFGPGAPLPNVCLDPDWASRTCGEEGGGRLLGAAPEHRERALGWVKIPGLHSLAMAARAPASVTIKIKV